MRKSAHHLGRAVACSVAAIAASVALLGIGSAPARPTTTAHDRPPAATGAPAATSAPRPATATGAAQGRFAVGELVVRFIDTRRRVRFRGRPPQARPLKTVIWYPASDDPSRADAHAIRPVRTSPPFPLIVFGHGYDSTPTVYTRLLRAWAGAGYVVAAPIFPLSNADAPGGPDESDIVNQPADISFVITEVLAAAAARHGILSGLIDAHAVAVAGQSDGAATALATAYDPRYQDRRVDAAVILSGAEIMPGKYFERRNPPLLAAQGTADRVNLPRYTYQFFRAAHSPKFLLTLLGARHLAPYTSEQPQLGIVERVTIAFLDLYLKRSTDARARLWSAGTSSPQVAKLSNGR